MLPTDFRNALLICTATLSLAGAAAAGDDHRRGDPYDRESRDVSCLVKQERDGSDIVEVDAKLGEYKEEVEC